MKKDHTDTTWINLGLDVETNILKQNILSINGSEYNGAYLYNKQQATFEALWYKNNTFFAFMIFFSKIKTFLSSYILCFLSRKCNTFYYVLKDFFYKNNYIFYWRKMLFSLLKLYDERKYYILIISY